MFNKAAQGLANKLFGHKAEQKAQKFLRKMGFEIIALNWACKSGELDIVAFKDEVLHFCEVKASAAGYAPEQYLTPSKIKKLKKSIAEFLQSNAHLAQGDYCFDLIAISDKEINFLENIYI